MKPAPKSAPLAPPPFRINAPNVALQIIDGEAILIHFERGHYFSARGFGCEILRHFARGTQPAEAIADLARRSAASPELVSSALADYAERLLAEDLITAHAAGAPQPDSVEEPPPGRLEFTQPELVKYTDLEDLLLLDPIHDVDDGGWPARPSASAKDPAA
jgi:hypothetical protein